MSTRANIVLQEGAKKLWFYRHSDGYPDGIMPTLKLFTDLIKNKKIRNNLSQAAGWLIILGAIEYQTLPNNIFSENDKKSWEHNHDIIDQALQFQPADWKVGAYEPTTDRHGDIEYIYYINVVTGEIFAYEANHDIPIDISKY